MDVIVYIPSNTSNSFDKIFERYCELDVMQQLTKGMFKIA